ncbi:hypothetical protein BOX15_Mlig024273g1, partial [Macrostomum lignano]
AKALSHLTQAMATADQLRAALDADDCDRLLQLCGQLDTNLTVRTASYEGPVVHQVARRPYGLDCLKLLVRKFGTACLSKSRDEHGFLAVHLAAQYQSAASMEFIYSCLGPACLKLRGYHGRTMVHTAALNPHSNSALKWLVQKAGPNCLRVEASGGSTPAHLSAMIQGCDSLQFIKEQLGSGCFKQRCEFGRTVVHEAAMNLSSNSAFRWLVSECGSDSLMETDKQGCTPVHLAAFRQGSDSMQFIKEQLGPDVFMLKGLSEDTSVHCAARNVISNSAFDWCVKELGADCLLAKNAFGETPVHQAAQHQDEKSMQLAVSSLGPKCLTVASDKQRTAAHFAAINCRSSSALRWIVGQLGPDCLQLRDTDGSLALHLAARHQDVDSLRLIKETLGIAAFGLTNRSGQTVAHYAAANSKKQQLMDWLLSEVGPQCLVLPDSNGRTAAEMAGYSLAMDR